MQPSTPNPKPPLRLLIAGGGTGGHIYPGLAVADEWRKAGGAVAFAGVPGNLEARLVPEAGYPFIPVEVHGFTRGHSLAARLQLLKAVGFLATLAPLRQALRAVRLFKPDVVLGSGGYVSGPVLLAAWLCRVPTMILQLDALPGVANRAAGLFVTRIGVALPEAADRFHRKGSVRVVGAPVRTAIVSTAREEGLAALGLEANLQTVLVFGGSLGSKAINEAVIGAIRLLGQQPSWGSDKQVVHITGKANPITLPAEEAGEMGLRYHPMEYCHEMPLALAAADIAICRSGAITIAELTARGLPAILIPWSGAADNHQEGNARSLERHGAAKVILDRDLTPESLAALLSEVLSDGNELARMSDASKRLGKPDAAAVITVELEGLAEGKRNLTPGSSP